LLQALLDAMPTGPWPFSCLCRHLIKELQAIPDHWNAKRFTLVQLCRHYEGRGLLSMTQTKDTMPADKDRCIL
jgi:hypothetical protein